jgi:hypothetical protein
MIIWSILRPLEIFYGHLVYFLGNWYISPRFGILHQENSGNPVTDSLHLDQNRTEAAITVRNFCGFSSCGRG